MTKTEQRAVARQARRWGYYRESAARLYLKCPECRQRVDCEFSVWGGTVTKQLDEAMLRHLDGYCEPT